MPHDRTGFDEERIEALGLDYEVIHASADAPLVAELESSEGRGVIRTPRRHRGRSPAWCRRP
jgi:hypothetical protein